MLNGESDVEFGRLRRPQDAINPDGAVFDLATLAGLVGLAVILLL
jgi:hypothetical protein